VSCTRVSRRTSRATTRASTTPRCALRSPDRKWQYRGDLQDARAGPHEAHRFEMEDRDRPAGASAPCASDERPLGRGDGAHTATAAQACRVAAWSALEPHPPHATEVDDEALFCHGERRMEGQAALGKCHSESAVVAYAGFETVPRQSGSV